MSESNANSKKKPLTREDLVEMHNHALETQGDFTGMYGVDSPEAQAASARALDILAQLNALDETAKTKRRPAALKALEGKDSGERSSTPSR
jgi:hypothetical protein